MQAHGCGTARDANPYARPVVYPIVDLPERERLQSLADDWWRGWDRANTARSAGGGVVEAGASRPEPR